MSRVGSALRHAAIVAAFVTMSACGPAPALHGGLSVSTPRALIDCATPPGGALQARLWVSGHEAPCALDVDDDGASGDCVVTPGIERRVTIDWFVDRGGIVIVLAQASIDVDLTRVAADVDVNFSDRDYITAGCLDMSVDSFAGSPTVEVFNTPQLVCDLDGDAESNVVELCAGRDPLGAV
jgi:hypothetical protein